MERPCLKVVLKNCRSVENLTLGRNAGNKMRKEVTTCMPCEGCCLEFEMEIAEDLGAGRLAESIVIVTKLRCIVEKDKDLG